MLHKKLLQHFIANPLMGVIVVLVLIFTASCFLSEYFLTSYNMSIIARSLAFVGLITLGQSLLMILGELDLSLGMIAGLCGIIGGILMVDQNINPYLALIICLMLGAFCGFLNGILVTGLRLHSLVLTIGMSGVYLGCNRVITQGKAITGIPESITFLGRGDIYGMPTPTVIMFVFLALVTFIVIKTPLGRYIYAIGNNQEAAKILGIRVNLVRIIIFSFAGFLAALAGMLMVARLGTAQPSIGESWVLPPIAASVIGGVATTGGIGRPIGAIIGAMIIGVIENIIVLFGVSPYWQSMVSGIVVVLAISFDSISRRYFRA